jgi:hypothetical protein
VPQSIHRYRGYLIGLERKHGVLLVSVSPATPDLPILGRCIDASTRCEAEAMVEAKNRVDRALFKLRRYVSDVSVDSQYS